NDEDHNHELDEREPGFGLFIAKHGVPMLHTAPFVCTALVRVRSTPPPRVRRTQSFRPKTEGPGMLVPGPIGSYSGRTTSRSSSTGRPRQLSRRSSTHPC